MLMCIANPSISLLIAQMETQKKCQAKIFLHFVQIWAIMFPSQVKISPTTYHKQLCNFDHMYCIKCE